MCETNRRGRLIRPSKHDTCPIVGSMPRVCWEAGYSDKRLVMSQHDVVLMLAQRLWHWPYIRTRLVLAFVWGGDDYEPRKRNTLQWAHVGLALGRRRRCWFNHRHVLVQHCTSIAQTFGICQTGGRLFNIRTLYFVSVPKLKRQYVLTCKASTYCHIISARAESMWEKCLSIVRHPSSLWHTVMQWGRGHFNDGTASLYRVRFNTHNPWNVIVLYLPLWEQELMNN